MWVPFLLGHCIIICIQVCAHYVSVLFFLCLLCLFFEGHEGMYPICGCPLLLKYCGVVYIKAFAHDAGVLFLLMYCHVVV